MLPFHWKLGPFALTPNELFALLGTVLGGLLLRRRLIALGAAKPAFIDFILAALAGGAVGARLYYFLPLWFRGKLALGALFSSWSDGSGFYGGFLGGALGIAITARLKKLPVLPVVDFVASTVPLGFAVGKIGCFLAGCCYGLPSPSGLRFAKDSLCYNTQRSAGLIGRGAECSLPVHPIQLYDMIFGFSLFGALTLLRRRSKRPGEVFAASLVGYSVYRFIIEFFRDDPDCHTFGGSTLRDSQYTAMVIVAIAGAAWAWLRLKKEPAETGPGTPK